MAKSAPTTAIYARYSSDMQKATSIDDQIRECLGFIGRQGWHPPVDGHLYEDRAVSGSVVGRAGYQALKAAAFNGEFDFIVVDDLSRLGRNAGESINAYQELTAFGVHIVGVADGINTDRKGAKLPYYFKSMMNDIFLDDLSDKVMRGLKGRAEQGYSAGGRVYGYEYTEVLDPSGVRDRSGRIKRLGVQISIDPEQAKVVKRIFALRGKGYGLRAIAKLLAVEGIPSPRYALRGKGEKTWAVGSIVTIVDNPKYRGDWTYNKHKWVKIPGSSKRLKRPNPESEWVISYRKDLRIVSDAVWKKAQRKKSGGSRRADTSRTQNAIAHPQVDNRGKFILSGLLKCSECGSNMIAMTDRGTSSYACNWHWSRGDIACTNKLRVPRKLVEDVVLSGIQEHFLDPKVIMRLVRKLQKRIEAMRKDPSDQIREREMAIERLQSEIENLTVFVVQGDTSQSIREALSAKEHELNDAQREIDYLHRQRDQAFPKISEEWVRSKVAKLTELLNSRHEKIPHIRYELRLILGDKIEMEPTGEGKERHYVARLQGRPLSILRDLPNVSQVCSATGLQP